MANVNNSQPRTAIYNNHSVCNPLAHLLGICRHSCSWSCSCRHSTGRGNDLLRQVVPRVGDTELHTFPHHRTAHPNASFYRKWDAKVQTVITFKMENLHYNMQSFTLYFNVLLSNSLQMAADIPLLPHKHHLIQ